MITQSVLKKISHVVSKGFFGLEKENLRVDKDGKLALTPHPPIFGDKEDNSYITTDFSESQLEMITPPLPSIEEAYNFMHTLHDVVSNEIGDEILWPQSMPPRLPEEELIPVAKYKETKELEKYRERIAAVYGKSRQMICGIHFNISLGDEVFVALQKELNDNTSIGDIKEDVYLKITRGLMRYRWMLIWMFGETPVADPTFKVRSLNSNEDRFIRCKGGLALRSGASGYRNRENYRMDFNSIDGYNKVVEELVSEGELYSAKELYLPIRMKFLDKDGGKPSYIEVRFLDLDPLSPSGVNKEALYAVYLVFLYALFCEEEGEFGEQEQAEATLRQDITSCYGRCSTVAFPKELGGARIGDEVLSIVQKMRVVLSDFGLMENKTYQETLDRMEEFAKVPTKRQGLILYKQYLETGSIDKNPIIDEIEGSIYDSLCCKSMEYRPFKELSFIDFHLNIAKAYKRESESNGYRFWGHEDMEMSTQLLMRAALCKGVNIEILDFSENFLRLSKGDNTQLVIQATKSAVDNYATVLAMENKVVTKRLLSEHNISVPAGSEYFIKQNAIDDFYKYQDKAIVIKPKSTNFGIGITILKDNQTVGNFTKALDIAFEHDECVLVEEFIEGREFRIFVIDDEVVGILHRVPANVEGDGIHTVRELVELKNLDPRRGKGYHTPLEKIALGKEEEMFLEMQGASFDTVVERGITLYLRENSNISTGGDSIDFTDDIHASYKAIAVGAARAVGAKITGVDMMIKDISDLATDANYSIIELNFNPAIHIHCFPYKGKNRRLNFKVLSALGFK